MLSLSRHRLDTRSISEVRSVQAHCRPQQQHEADAPPPALMPRRPALFAGAAAMCACACCGGLAWPARARSGWYDQYFAASMSSGMGSYEQAIRPVKQRLFEELLSDTAVSTILEVGVGTGPNMQFYAPAAERLSITGLDPNPAMQAYARESAAVWGLAEQLRLVQGAAEAMPFGAEGATPPFDAAVVTLVLCSVADPLAALRQVRRVVRPGGRLLLIEHVLAPEPGLLRLQQRLFDPLQQLLADGCHLTRDTAGAVAASGWGVGGLTRFSVPGMYVIGPHIAGVLA